jgi:hypothetical protein
LRRRVARSATARVIASNTSCPRCIPGNLVERGGEPQSPRFRAFNLDAGTVGVIARHLRAGETSIDAAGSGPRADGVINQW